MGHKRPRARRQRAAGGPGLEGSDCGPGRGGGPEGAGRGGTQERPRRRTRVGRERRTAQWGSSLQAEGSCVLTGSALRLRGLNTLGNGRAGTPVRPAPGPRASVPPNHPEEKGTRAGRVPSPVPSKAAMSGEGGGAPSSGRAGPASGGVTVLQPPVPGRAPSPGPGPGCPCLRLPSGFDAARIPGQPPWGPPMPPGLARGQRTVGQPSLLLVLAPRFPPRLTGPAARCPRWPRRLRTPGPCVPPGHSAVPGPSQASLSPPAGRHQTAGPGAPPPGDPAT